MGLRARCQRDRKVLSKIPPLRSEIFPPPSYPRQPLVGSGVRRLVRLGEEARRRVGDVCQLYLGGRAYRVPRVALSYLARGLPEGAGLAGAPS